MTDEEIKKYIDQQIKEIAGIKADGSAMGLKPTLSKWFRGDEGNVWTCEMYKALSPGVSSVKTYSMWDHIRRIATIMCKADSVREIKDYDKANYYADAICQRIYDLLTEEGAD